MHEFSQRITGHVAMSVKVIERLVALPSVSRAVVEDDVLAAKPSPEVSGPCHLGFSLALRA